MRRKAIEDLCFKKTHELVVKDGRLRFVGRCPDEDAGVYVWVAARAGSEKIEIVYVGKAGYGVSRRLRQHEGGFINSGTGRKNAESLLEILSSDGKVQVYARRSKTAELFMREVSLYSAEEDALCSLLQPRLNRASFPRIAPIVAATADDVLQRLGEFLTARFAEHSPEARDDFEAQWASISQEARSRVLDLIETVEERILEPHHKAKLIKSYAGQPRGCSNVPILNFGVIGQKGKMLNGSWITRITLTDEPRLILPLARYAASPSQGIDFARNGFSPTSTAAFLQHPEIFLRPRGSQST